MSDTGVPAAKRIIPALAPITEALSPYAEPTVRVVAGLLLVPHGAQKLFGWLGGHGIVGTGEFFASKLGLPASVAVLAGLIEFTGGLLLAVGLATRAAAALVAGLMAVDSPCPPAERLLLDRRWIRVPAAVGDCGACIRHPWRRQLFARCPDRP